jgi:hypothetical protein
MGLVVNLNERDYLEDLSVDGRILLKEIFNKRDGRARTGLIWFITETSSGMLLTR